MPVVTSLQHSLLTLASRLGSQVAPVYTLLDTVCGCFCAAKTRLKPMRFSKNLMLGDVSCIKHHAA